MYDKIEAYMKYKNHHLKINEEEYESKFDDYRDIDEEETNIYINKKLGEFPSHKLLQELSLIDLLWDFDVVSIYPSAMSIEKSIYPQIETVYAYTPNMNNDLVEKFINQTFTQGSAILKLKYFNPKTLFVQHLPVKEKINRMEVNRMRNGYIIDVLTSDDIQEIVKIGGNVIKIYESVVYREYFKVSTFKKVIDKLFELRQKHRDEKNDVMQLLVKLITNSLYGKQIRKDIEDS